MTPPLYNVGDKVYLRESAALGFLEPTYISGAELAATGWVYRFHTHAPTPGIRQVYGDRRLFANGSVLYLDESELVTYCEALRLATANAQANLTRLQNLSTSVCP